MSDDKSTRLATLRKPRRSAVTLSEGALTRTRELTPGEPLPLVVEPADGSLKLNLESWVSSNREWIEGELRTRGGVLFRGFDVGSVAAFQAAAAALSGPLLDYNEPSTARSRVEDKVYTSTEYSADQSIPMHNELSYAASWPRKIWFHAVTVAPEGGRTPISDSRRVYDAIDPALRRKFEEKGVMYVRKYGFGMGRPWTAVFGTDDRAAVEERCRAAGIEFEWVGDDRLITRHVRPATAKHPETGEAIWFNQAHLHHVTALPPALRESILKVSEDPSLPLDINSLYGDGSEIPESELDQVRAAFDANTISFDWFEGDTIVLDNMLVAHAREPYRGARKIVVAMSDPYDRTGTEG